MKNWLMTVSYAGFFQWAITVTAFALWPVTPFATWAMLWYALMMIPYRRETRALFLAVAAQR